MNLVNDKSDVLDASDQLLREPRLFISNHMTKGTVDTQCFSLNLGRGERLGKIL